MSLGEAQAPVPEGDGAVSANVGNRGASDPETLWAIAASQARGHGSLCELGALRTTPMPYRVLKLAENYF